MISIRLWQDAKARRTCVRVGVLTSSTHAFAAAQSEMTASRDQETERNRMMSMTFVILSNPESRVGCLSVIAWYVKLEAVDGECLFN